MADLPYNSMSHNSSGHNSSGHNSSGHGSSGDDRTTIVCLYCGKPQPVSRKAMSVSCRFCNKSLRIEDIRLSAYTARRTIETVGILTIEKKANVISERIACGGLIIRGKVKASVLSRGPVLIGPEAELKGDVTAPTLAVGAGAVLEGHYEIGKPTGESATPADGSAPAPPSP
jgi:hypothetical protein